MCLTQYGRREWLGATIVAAGLCAAVIIVASKVNAWLALLLPLPVLVWLGVLWFFRDPERAAPQGPGLLLSPADGRVADITEIGPDSPLGREGVKIGIFMNVFDVHVNRSPAAARVGRVEHTPGAFLDVRDPQAPLRNECATIHLTHERDGVAWPLVVRQIAGLIARRIVTDLNEGQDLAPGQRLGMIKFGSRLELLAPRELIASVPVQIGQRVRAGVSVLATAQEVGDG